ncbi:MAG: hypothetical protein JNL90_20675 [Planctomycetes bacterium]|nr:hypothetical protein [Planctomycetota bacterium]
MTIARRPRSRVARIARWCATVAVVAALSTLAPAARAQLGPPPAPPENPITAEKAVLGKILFWDEQLSSDRTMACGSCHQPHAGGSDPATFRSAGRDGQLFTRDDRFGSPGVRLADASGSYLRSAVGFERQVTDRLATEFMAAAYFDELFWDGRARSRFVDPATGKVAIASGGALESQLVGPPVSSVEMSHAGRVWSEIEALLGEVEPLALASDWPTDVAAALARDPTYPDLFRRAFGDAAITTERIAFAIATYERTLAPRKTPWDLWSAGNPLALTAAQQRGFALFQGKGRCAMCHTPPLFSDGGFHAIGGSPWQDDAGRAKVTGRFADRGRFKTPTLRNAGLRPRFLHDGRFETLQQVIDLYVRGGDFRDNLDVLMVPVPLTADEQQDLLDFLANGLTDPDVATASGLYARPTLHAERAPNPSLYGAPGAGSGGIAPRLIAQTPPQLGHATFRLAVVDGLGGAAALLALAYYPAPPGSDLNGIPLHVACDPLPYLVPLTLSGSGAGAGDATFVLPLADDPALLGESWYAQAFVADPAAQGGWSATAGAKCVFE